MPPPNTISNHILPTSSTMVGVCMTVISIIKLTNNGDSTWADELLALDSILFLTSIMLSYLSLRKSHQGGRYEELADRSFMVGISIMVLAALILAFKII